MKDPLNIQGKAVNFDLTKCVCVCVDMVSNYALYLIKNSVWV